MLHDRCPNLHMLSLKYDFYYTRTAEREPPLHIPALRSLSLSSISVPTPVFLLYRFPPFDHPLSLDSIDLSSLSCIVPSKVRILQRLHAQCPCRSARARRSGRSAVCSPSFGLSASGAGSRRVRGRTRRARRKPEARAAILARHEARSAGGAREQGAGTSMARLLVESRQAGQQNGLVPRTFPLLSS